MFVLIICGTWHAIVGTLIFDRNNFDKITPTSYWLWVDRYMLIALGSIFITAHVFFIVWHIRVPIHKRQELRRQDNAYRKMIAQKMRSSSKQQVTTDGSCKLFVEMH
jgi:hypothetical protein